MSKLLILVGAPGAGKTFKAKQLIQNVHPGALLIFDVNAEYSEYYKKEFDGDIDNFVEQIKRLKKAVIVIEDATGFLPVNGRNMPLVRCLQARRHTGNTFILLFHSMRTVPKYLMDFTNAFILFKTVDIPKRVEETFGDVSNGQGTLYEAWHRVYTAAQNHKFFSSYPPPKGVAPPSEVFKMY